MALPPWSEVWESIVELRPAILQGCNLTPNEDGWVGIHCPLHQDEDPSLRVNVEKGGIKCMAGCDVGRTLNDLEDLVLGFATRTKRPDDVVGDLAKRRMLPRDWLIDTFGVEPARAGYAFPVDDPETDPSIEIDYEIDGLRDGRRREHVLWKRGAWLNQKATSLAKYRWEPPLKESGTKAAHLVYNLERIRKHLPKQKLVYICAGPPDVWVMHKASFPAISFLAGETGLPSSRAISKVKDAGVCEAIIIYDQDAAGREGAEKLGIELAQSGINASALFLPEDVGKSGDLTDLWVRCEGDAATFENALAKAETRIWRNDDVSNRTKASRKRRKAAVPSLPDKCFVPPFDVYYDAVEPSTSACREYHFFALMNIIGALFGRRAYVKYGRILYPNQYTVLVGRTHSYKSTANNRALELIEALYGREAGAKRLNGTRLSVQEATGSAEGLLEAAVFADATPDDEAAIRGMLGWSQRDKKKRDADGEAVPHEEFHEGDLYDQMERRLLIHQDEFAKMLSKARQGGGGSGFIPHLLTTFDCPNEIRLRTRTKPLTLVYPAISILSDSTEEQLGKYFDDLEWSTGFGNRIMFVKGPDNPPKPFPPGLDEKLWDDAVTLIRRAYNRVTNNALHPQEKPGVEFKLTPETEEKWTELYMAWMEDREDGWTEEQLAATERTADYAMKFALVYALTAEDSDEHLIQPEDVDLGWAVALHGQSVAAEMVSSLVEDRQARWQQRIQDYIEVNDKVTASHLQQNFKQIPVTTLRLLLEGLVQMKVIENTAEGYRPFR